MDDMLDEISSESLLQLLTSVQYESNRHCPILVTHTILLTFYQASPPGSTQIPALDSHFFSAIQHHPSSLSSLNRADVLEIQGPPASGKTHFLYFLLATCIMPHSSTSTTLGGWEKAAFVFDADGAFSMSRFKEVLLGRLKRILPSHGSSAEDIALSCLHRLHVFRPNSSVQLAATIMHLPTYFASHFPDTEMGLVAVDSVSAFYWPDRFTAEQLRSAPTKRTHPIANPLQHVLFALQSLRLSYGPVIAITNWGLIPINDPNSASTATPLYRQHLDPFPAVATTPHPDLMTSVNPYAGSGPSLPLTHHISLCAVSHGLPRGNKLETLDTSGFLEPAFRGIVRTSGSSQTGEFIFHISKNEMLVK